MGEITGEVTVGEVEGEKGAIRLPSVTEEWWAGA
jgi:hypothetical protein